MGRDHTHLCEEYWIVPHPLNGSFGDPCVSCNSDILEKIYFFCDFIYYSPRSPLYVNIPPYPPQHHCFVEHSSFPHRAVLLLFLYLSFPKGASPMRSDEIQATISVNLLPLLRTYLLSLKSPHFLRVQIFVWVLFYVHYQTSNCEAVCSYSQRTIAVEFLSIPMAHLKIPSISQDSSSIQKCLGISKGGFSEPGLVLFLHLPACFGHSFSRYLWSTCCVSNTGLEHRTSSRACLCKEPKPIT